MPVISTNAASNSAVAYLNQNSAAESAAIQKIASGSRISQASDDAAGLAISTGISSDITTLQQAATNASQATSILQVADGGGVGINACLLDELGSFFRFGDEFFNFFIVDFLFKNVATATKIVRLGLYECPG